MGIRFFLRFNFPFFILIPSGRSRRLALIKSRIVISFSPSRFAVRASSRTRFSTPRICNSAESSIVTIRASFGTKSLSAFSIVVLPEPVPPEINMLYPACTNIFRTDATHASTLPIAINAFISIRCFGNRRIVITGPPSDTGLVTIHTREPSISRASTIGDAALIRRLQSPTIC